MGAAPRKNKGSRLPRALGNILGDRLADRREDVIDVFLEADEIFNLLGAKSLCRDLLRWVATHARFHRDKIQIINGVPYMEFPPYAVCRKEGPRHSLVGTGRLDKSARYVSNTLAKIARYSSSVRVAVEPDIRVGLAATFWLPVLGPVLADLQDEARAAKARAVEANMEDADFSAFANSSAADFLHLSPPSEEVHQPTGTQTHPKQYSRHQQRGRARGARAVPAGGGRAFPEGFEELLPLLLAELETAFPGQPREHDLRTALVGAVIPAGEAREILSLAIQEALAKGKALGYAIGALRNRPMADRLQRDEARRLEAEARAQAKATQQGTGAAEASREGQRSGAAAEPVLDAEGERLRDLIAATTLPQAHGEPSPVRLHRSSAARMAAALRAQGLGVYGGSEYFEGVAAEFAKRQVGAGYVVWRCVQDAGLARDGGRLLDRARRHQARANADGLKFANGWDAARDLIRQDPQAKMLYAAWWAARAAMPSPDAPGWQDAWDRTSEARRASLARAEALLPVAEIEALRAGLNAILDEAALVPDSLVRQRAWTHRWGRMVLAACGLEEPAEAPTRPSASTPKPAPDPWFSDVDEADDECMPVGQAEEDQPDPIAPEPEIMSEPAPSAAAPVLELEPKPRDAWSAEAVKEGTDIYDQILALLAQDPKSTAAKNLRNYAGEVRTYVPGRRLVLSWSAAAPQDFQRILGDHARKGAKALGIPDLIIEFRCGKPAA